jgi:hypothetical protein
LKPVFFIIFTYYSTTTFLAFGFSAGFCAVVAVLLFEVVVLVVGFGLVSVVEVAGFAVVVFGTSVFVSAGFGVSFFGAGAGIFAGAS